MRHETAIFGPQKPKFTNFSYHFFCLFSSLSTTKNPKIAETSVLANLKKENFQNLIDSLRSGFLQTTFACPFFFPLPTVPFLPDTLPFLGPQNWSVS